MNTGPARNSSIQKAWKRLFIQPNHHFLLVGFILNHLHCMRPPRSVDPSWVMPNGLRCKIYVVYSICSLGQLVRLGYYIRKTVESGRVFRKGPRWLVALSRSRLSDYAAILLALNTAYSMLRLEILTNYELYYNFVGDFNPKK